MKRPIEQFTFLEFAGNHTDLFGNSYNDWLLYDKINQENIIVTLDKILEPEMINYIIEEDGSWYGSI